MSLNNLINPKQYLINNYNKYNEMNNNQLDKNSNSQYLLKNNTKLLNDNSNATLINNNGLKHNYYSMSNLKENYNNNLYNTINSVNKQINLNKSKSKEIINKDNNNNNNKISYNSKKFKFDKKVKNDEESLKDIDFNNLAKKLRQERFDKNEILYYKQNAVYIEKIKNKKKKLATIIQKVFRGYIIRKQVRNKIDKINTEAIIRYLNYKRLMRIKSRHKKILSLFIENYIIKQRDIKRRIYYNYLNYCSSQISSLIKGYKFRKTFLPYYLNYKSKCNKIFEFMIGKKVQSILITEKLMTWMLEISTLKNCLRKLEKNEENYKDLIKEEHLMNEDELNIIENHEIELKQLNNFNDNLEFENIDNNNISSEDNIKFIKSKHNSNDYKNKLQKALYNKEYCVSKLNQMKEDFSIQKEVRERRFYDKYYKLYLTGLWTKEKLYKDIRNDVNNKNKISLLKNYIKQMVINLNSNTIFKEEYDNYEYFKEYSNTSQIGDINICEDKDINDNAIKKNTTEEINENELKSSNEFIESTELILNKDIKEKYINNKESEYNTEKQNLINPDDRIIKLSNNGYDLSNIPESAFVSNNESQKKNKNIEHIRRKPPKYDARKAIEKEKEKYKDKINEKSNSKEPVNKGKKDRDNFRKFLKQVKNENTDKKKHKTQEDIDKELETEIRNKLKNLKKEDIDKNYNDNQLISKSNNMYKTIKNKNEKRKKLHELEKSPKNFNTKNVKSKIDCWVQDSNNQGFASYAKKSLYNNNIYESNKQSFRFNPQILNRIDQELVNINNKMSYSEYLINKKEKFKEIPISYIKENSFYVKHYSPEIYEQLLIHLNKHYEELKS